MATYRLPVPQSHRFFSPVNQPSLPFQSIPASELRKQLSATVEGLSCAEAKLHLSRDGTNLWITPIHLLGLSGKQVQVWVRHLNNVDGYLARLRRRRFESLTDELTRTARCILFVNDN